jgi:hypothetical protein
MDEGWTDSGITISMGIQSNINTDHYHCHVYVWYGTSGLQSVPLCVIWDKWAPISSTRAPISSTRAPISSTRAPISSTMCDMGQVGSNQFHYVWYGTSGLQSVPLCVIWDKWAPISSTITKCSLSINPILHDIMAVISRANSLDPDQLAHPCHLLRIYTVRFYIH